MDWLANLLNVDGTGITFFVREGISGINSFLISSNERWGDKAGSRPSKQKQVLELFAPAQYWQSIKELVEEADGLQRRVYFNKNFSQKFIDKCTYQKRDFL